MTDRPTLLLVVGATKAGTTWLYRYLADHAECHFRAVKELHYFDALDSGNRDRQIRRLARDRDRLARQIPEAEPLAAARLSLKVADHEEALALHRAEGERVDLYLDYLMRDAGEARVVGDITPAYGLLSKDRLAMMARLTPAVRVVYLMRDPVDRLWSQIRMHVERGTEAGSDLAARAHDRLARLLGGEEHRGILDRGDYVTALTRLREAVPAAQLFVEFYERLLSEAGIRRLCAFLGLGFRPAPLTRRVHAGVPVTLAPEERRAAARLLAPQYDFVEKTYGPLPDAWQANLARV